SFLILVFLSSILFPQHLLSIPVNSGIKEKLIKVEKDNNDKKLKKKGGFFKKLSNKIISKRLEKIVRKMGVDLFDCDRIIKTDGEEIDVKIVEVGIRDIKYKKCNLEDGPTYSIDREDVFIIRYTNGEKEIITDINSLKRKDEIAKRFAEEENTKGLWAIGLLLGVTLGFIGLLIGVIVFKGVERKKIVSGALTGILILAFLALITFGLFVLLFGGF
ncbi:MAG: hypothetical protein GY705_07535, partial [Bacteroidetes bacterium]|nr:hypothetical protein [Bacteroidota bacterium]